MSSQFTGNFAYDLENFISEKHALGHPYLASEDTLRQFDRFCLREFSDETMLTQEVFEKWAVLRENEKPQSFNDRMAPLREFARYLNRLNKEAYILSYGLNAKEIRPIPHVFTTGELTAFFHGADSFAFSERSPFRHLVVPVLFRLLYCCGLRPGEALKLTDEDVNLQQGTLHIALSKGHKDRIIPISDQMLQLLKNYYKKLEGDILRTKLFFPSPHGKVHSGFWLDRMFWMCWELAGVANFSGSRPRVYDFRHTFATKRLYLWIGENKNPEALLPYLGAYLGHAYLSDTAYYIHLVEEFFPQMARMDFTKLDSLIPEVHS